MQPGVPAHPPEGSNAKPSFRRPTSDASNRKYRRHSPANGSDSSLSGSPRGNLSPVMEDRHGASDDRQRRDDGREILRNSGRSRSNKTSYSHKHFERNGDGNSSKSRRHEVYSRENNEGSEKNQWQELKGGHSRLNTRYSKFTESSSDIDKSSKDNRENYRSTVSEREQDDRNRYKYTNSRRNRYSNEGWRENARNSAFGREDTNRGGDREMSPHRDDMAQKRKLDERGSEKGEKKYIGEVEEKKSRSRTISKNMEISGRNEYVSGKHAEKNSKVGHLEDDKSLSSLKISSETSEPATISPQQAEDLNAAKFKAMQAAAIVNRNLVGGGSFMSTDQKKKLLWGNKKNNSAEESSNRWDLNLFQDPERQEKFNKLMGVKGETSSSEPRTAADKAEKNLEQVEIDLEKQYTAGLRRRDGRTVGLGL